MTTPSERDGRKDHDNSGPFDDVSTNLQFSKSSKRTLTRENSSKTFANAIASAPNFLMSFISPKISAGLREKVMLGVTSVTDCGLCKWGHSHWALAHGVSLEEINQILRQENQALWATDPAEAAAILFAQQYAESLDEIDNAAFENLALYFSPAQVEEILAYVRTITLGSLIGNTVETFLNRLRGLNVHRDRVPEFFLFTGGPISQLIKVITNSSSMALITLGAILLAWMPLLVLSFTGGQEIGHSVQVPFLKDLEVHVRLLVAMPLLVIAANATGARVSTVPQQFMERRLISELDIERVKAAVNSALRLRSSIIAEIIIITFVYAVGTLIWRRYITVDMTTWYATPSASGSTLSAAGVWYAWISLPLFQYLLCRWYFRLFIWARFLWQVSRIGLKLIPTHPDRLGGLGFLSNAVQSLALFAAAHGALLAGYLAVRIVSLGAPLTQFNLEIAAMVGLIYCVGFAPLLVFTPQLLEAKHRGLRRYGELATRYVIEFDEKWLEKSEGRSDSLVGSSDIQSLADMSNSYDLVRKMRITPITSDSVQRLTLATLAPIVPLLITMMPVSELVEKLIRVLL